MPREVAREGARPPLPRGRRGFTLIEVAISLAILGLALGVFMDGTIGSLSTTSDVRHLTRASLLAPAVMAEIEHKLAKDGFPAFDETKGCEFEIQGLNEFGCEYSVKKVDLPIGDMLMKLFTGGGGGALAGAGALLGDGGVAGLAAAAGGGASNPAAAVRGALGAAPGLAANALGLYQQQIETLFEEALREVRLTLSWKVGKKETESMTVVTHLVSFGRAGTTGMDRLAGQISQRYGLQANVPSTSGAVPPGFTGTAPPLPPNVRSYIPRKR